MEFGYSGLQRLFGGDCHVCGMRNEQERTIIDVMSLKTEDICLPLRSMTRLSI